MGTCSASWCGLDTFDVAALREGGGTTDPSVSPGVTKSADPEVASSSIASETALPDGSIPEELKCIGGPRESTISRSALGPAVTGPREMILWIHFQIHSLKI
jgi:hypothetical protein